MSSQPPCGQITSYCCHSLTDLQCPITHVPWHTQHQPANHQQVRRLDKQATHSSHHLTQQQDLAVAQAGTLVGASTGYVVYNTGTDLSKRQEHANALI